jgi:hypothetical protein
MRIASCALVTAALLLACATQPTPIVVTQEVLVTSAPVYVEVTSAVTNTPRPTPSPRPTTVPPCIHAAEVTLEDVGRTLAVCGRVTRAGRADCANCKYGQVWFMVLDKTFTIYAYDWEFTAD